MAVYGISLKYKINFNVHKRKGSYLPSNTTQIFQGLFEEPQRELFKSGTIWDQIKFKPRAHWCPLGV